MTETKRRCFVIQRFDGDKYDQRFDDVFAPAIKAVGLEPYRVDRDKAADVPIETIESEIEAAVLCLADITEDNPNVWYEVGYAFALKKAVCLVCWAERGNQKFPFDIQHRKVETLKTRSPSDFKDAEVAIRERLEALLVRAETLGAVAKMSPVQQTGGLQPHEIAVLVNLTTSFGEPMFAVELIRIMDDSGFTRGATGLAVMTLEKMGYVIRGKQKDYQGDLEVTFAITSVGAEWLSQNRDCIVLRHAPPQPKPRKRDPALNDDIPF